VCSKRSTRSGRRASKRTQSKQRLNDGERQYIERLKNNADKINDWLRAYKEEGKNHGFLARGLKFAKIAKNAAKKAIGYQTSYDQLLQLVKDLDENLRNLNITITLDIHGVTQHIHAQLSEVVVQQQKVMDMVQQRLNALPPGSKVPENTAKEIAGWVRVDFERVVRDLRVENHVLWGEVHEFRAEVQAGFQGLNHQMHHHHQQQQMVLQMVEEMRKDVMEMLKQALAGPVVPLNLEAQDFWKQSFKDSPVQVDCKTFAGRLKQRYPCIQDYDLMIADGLDVDGDGKVDIEEFRLWAKDGVQSAVDRALQKSRKPLAAQAQNLPIPGGGQWFFECVHSTPAPAQRRWRVAPRLRACALRAFA